MPIIEGARQRLGAEAGAAGDPTGYGPAVYSGTAQGGTPAGGTAGFGAGTLEPAAIVQSVAAKKLFYNTGTKANPTWTPVA
jgi:hypothetical protein